MSQYFDFEDFIDDNYPGIDPEEDIIEEGKQKKEEAILDENDLEDIGLLSKENSETKFTPLPTFEGSEQVRNEYFLTAKLPAIKITGDGKVLSVLKAIAVNSEIMKIMYRECNTSNDAEIQYIAKGNTTRTAITHF